MSELPTPQLGTRGGKWPLEQHSKGWEGEQIPASVITHVPSRTCSFRAHQEHLTARERRAETRSPSCLQLARRRELRAEIRFAPRAVPRLQDTYFSSLRLFVPGL